MVLLNFSGSIDAADELKTLKQRKKKKT